MRHLAAIALCVLALTAPAAAADSPDSNYNGWEDTSGAIMCQPNHQGWYVYVNSWYQCRFGFIYHPDVPNGLWFPGWGYVQNCPGYPPFYGSCWAWRNP